MSSSHPQLSRISHALAGAQQSLHLSDASVQDLQTKIADTKDDISAISSQINSLRKTMAQKYELQEHLEDLLPLALQERERALNRVRRLEHALDDLERHLTAEDWYEEEEMEEFATGHAADRYAKFLKEVGRVSPQAQADRQRLPDVSISQRVQQLALDPSYQADGLNTIEQDIRLVRPTENDTLPTPDTLEPKENQSIYILHDTEACGTATNDHQPLPSHITSPKTNTPESSQVASPPDCTQNSVIQSPLHDLIDFDQVGPQFSPTIPDYPVSFAQNPSLHPGPDDARSHFYMNAPESINVSLAE